MIQSDWGAPSMLSDIGAGEGDIPQMEVFFFIDLIYN